MLFWEYRWSYNTPGRADTLSSRAAPNTQTATLRNCVFAGSA